MASRHQITLKDNLLLPSWPQQNRSLASQLDVVAQRFPPVFSPPLFLPLYPHSIPLQNLTLVMRASFRFSSPRSGQCPSQVLETLRRLQHVRWIVAEVFKALIH